MKFSHPPDTSDTNDPEGLDKDQDVMGCAYLPPMFQTSFIQLEADVPSLLKRAIPGH